MLYIKKWGTLLGLSSLLLACGDFSQYRNMGSDLLFKDVKGDYSEGDPVLVQRQSDLENLWALSTSMEIDIPKTAAGIFTSEEELLAIEDLSEIGDLTAFEGLSNEAFNARIDSFIALKTAFAAETNSTLQTHLTAQLSDAGANSLVWVSGRVGNEDDLKLYILGYESLGALQSGKLVLAQFAPDVYTKLYTTHYEYEDLKPNDATENHAKLSFIGNSGSKAYTVGDLKIYNFDTMGYAISGSSGAAYTAYPRVLKEIIDGKPCLGPNGSSGNKLMNGDDPNGWWGNVASEAAVSASNLSGLATNVILYGMIIANTSPMSFNPFDRLKSELKAVCVSDVKRHDSDASFQVIVPYQAVQSLPTQLQEYQDQSKPRELAQLSNLLVYASQAMLRYGGMGTTAGNTLQGMTMRNQFSDGMMGFAVVNEVEDFDMNAQNVMWARGFVDAESTDALGTLLSDLGSDILTRQAMGYKFVYKSFELFPGIKLDGHIGASTYRMAGEISFRNAGGQEIVKVNYDNVIPQHAWPTEGNFRVGENSAAVASERISKAGMQTFFRTLQ